MNRHKVNARKARAYKREVETAQRTINWLEGKVLTKFDRRELDWAVRVRAQFTAKLEELSKTFNVESV